MNSQITRLALGANIGRPVGGCHPSAAAESWANNAGNTDAADLIAAYKKGQGR